MLALAEPATDTLVITPEIQTYIRRRREELGWTPTEIGNALGLSHTYTINLESGLSGRSKYLPALLACLQSGELPDVPEDRAIGKCRRCTLLIYENEEDLPNSAIPIQVASIDGYCQACKAEADNGHD